MGLVGQAARRAVIRDALKVAHRCTDCRAPARQRADGRWLSTCADCAAKAKRNHKQRYLRLLIEHRCPSCGAPAVQYADQMWYVRCAIHMTQQEVRNKARAAQPTKGADLL